MSECTDRVLLQSGFFDRDPGVVARDLLGKMLTSRVDGVEAGGRIVETEAYLGADDPGSHAATKGITTRNATMYGPPGTVYVYLTYGVHHMLNLVCGAEGTAGAVLVRAIEPLEGVEAMRRRRSVRSDREISSGPGKVAAALGIDLSDNGTVLGSGRLVVYDAPAIAHEAVVMTGRIGLSAGHDLPLRFYVSGAKDVSKGRPGKVSPTRRKDVRTPANRDSTDKHRKRGRS